MKDNNFLYPLKFNPIYKQNKDGGSKIKEILHREETPESGCLESWEISTDKDNVSVVANGALSELPLDLLIRVFKHELVGVKNYNEYKDNFPLLIKYIDAQQDLPIQVHPDNELVLSYNNFQAKSKMWYIMEAEEDAKIINGYGKRLTKNGFCNLLGNLHPFYNTQNVKPGDEIDILAGTIHAVGSGIMLAEIQHNSEITYAEQDYNSTDASENKCEFHLEIGEDVNDNATETSLLKQIEKGNCTKVESYQNFTRNSLSLNNEVLRDYSNIDSFVVYILLSGSAILKNEMYEETLMSKGDVFLIPACIDYTIIEPLIETKILEIYN